MSRTWQIADLLARRDGEPHDAALFVPGDGHEEAGQEVSRIKAGLQQLPDVPIDEEIWQQIQPELASTQQPSQSGWLRYRYATAAGVFLLCMLSVATLISGPDFDSPARLPIATTSGESEADDVGAIGQLGGAMLAGLMQRSRELEARIATDPRIDPNAQVRVQPVAADALLGGTNERPLRREEALILYRLADVDAQIAQLYERDQNSSTAERIALWRMRVSLLQNLVVLRDGGQGVANEFSRSM